jgi:hypothetical protein
MARIEVFRLILKKQFLELTGGWLELKFSGEFGVIVLVSSKNSPSKLTEFVHQFQQFTG